MRSLKTESRSSSDIELVLVEDTFDDIQSRQFRVGKLTDCIGISSLFRRENGLTEFSAGWRLAGT